MQEQPAVRVRARTHPVLPARGQVAELGSEGAVVVEELLRPVAAHPLLELGEVRGIGTYAGQRHLVRPERALDAHAVDLAGTGPALRRPQHDHRPAWPLAGAAAGATAGAAVARLVLDRDDAGVREVEGGRQLLVDLGRVVAGHDVRRVAVALQEAQKFGLGDPREDRRTGDLVAVQVQDREHGTIAGGIEELVRVPARGERPGLGLAVTDDAARQQVGVVEDRAVRVDECVPEFAALVDRAGRLRRDVARYPAGERELPEEPAQPLRVPGHLWIDLAVGPFEIGVRDQAGATVTGPGDVQRVQAVRPDQTVHVRVDEVEPGGGPPVPEQPRLDVLGTQRLAQERVVEQVDLPDGQIVGRSPVRIEEGEFGRGQCGRRVGDAGAHT